METKISTKITLNVLSLEDSILDFEMISHQLTRAGYELNMFRVETEKDFAALLKKNKYDIILADFSLPGFDAFGALRLCNKICPNVPFICVSGSIGEETAIELLKLGAVDYVLKDRPERLPFTIKRALDEAKIKEIHQKGENELRKLSRAVEQSPESIVITSTDGTIEYANPKTTQLTGFPLPEIIGKNSRIFSSGEKSREEYALMWNAIRAGKEWIGEFHNKKKSGELYWESASISPILDENGVITHYLAIKLDITEKKQMIEELILAKEKAEESDNLKSAFLNNISHEIRTPFNSLLGFLSLLQDNDLTIDERIEYTDIVNKSAIRLMNTIDDILVISQIQLGQIKLKFSKVIINLLFDNLITRFTTDAENIGLKISFNNNLPVHINRIYSDGAKLNTIIFNLIGNAIKFTKTGSIKLGMRMVDKVNILDAIDNETKLYVNRKHSLSQIEFSVIDTGIGIPKNMHTAIFEKFFQADSSNTRQFEGSGLGLSISKAYVEMLGGKIWVESEEGKGAAFYFTIPYVVEQEGKIAIINTTSDNVVKPHNKFLKILIAEDDISSALLIELALKKFSKEILFAKTGLQAVEVCRSNPDIDLILMDIKMPELNGYEATRQIRQFNTSVVIFAQTAFSLIGDREKTIEAGCNEYIAKPIKKEKLIRLIENHFTN